MSTYGYIRKNHLSQTAEQLQVMIEFDCKLIFIEEKALSADTQLERLLHTLAHKDRLVVDSISSFGKTENELKQLFGQLAMKKIHLISQSDDLDSENSGSFYDLTKLIFKINKECQRSFVTDGTVASKERGKVIGRPTLTDKTIEKINKLSKDNKLSMRRIALECGVSLGSVHKYIKNERLASS